MGLNKQNTDYFYNLGRTVALVQIMNNLDICFATSVYDNANDKFPFQLKEALKKSNHNLINELISPADVVLNKGVLPGTILEPQEQGNRYWIGFYHEKSYLEKEYDGLYGNVETFTEIHIPDSIEFTGDDNIVGELLK